jgi:exosome complex exonuclease DIS3/RRP44
MVYPALQVTDYLALRRDDELTLCLLIVRRYVEGMPESTQLVDLLSAGSNSIEPTAAAGRPPLYPEVSSFQCPIILVVTEYVVN